MHRACDFPHWNASIPLFHQGSQCRLQLFFLQEMANFRWFDSVNYGKAMKSSPQGPTTNNPNEPLISTPHIFHLFPPYQTCETSFEFWISWGYTTGTKLNQKIGGWPIQTWESWSHWIMISWEPPKKTAPKWCVSSAATRVEDLLLTLPTCLQRWSQCGGIECHEH